MESKFSNREDFLAWLKQEFPEPTDPEQIALNKTIEELMLEMAKTIDWANVDWDNVELPPAKDNKRETLSSQQILKILVVDEDAPNGTF